MIELEGNAHEGQERSQYDRARADLLMAAGYTVIRIRNRDVTRERLESLLSDGRTFVVPPLPKGEGVRG